MEFAAKILKQLAGVDFSALELKTIEKLNGFSIDRVTEAFNVLTKKEVSQEDISKALAAIRISKERPKENPLKEYPSGIRSLQWDDSVFRGVRP